MQATIWGLPGCLRCEEAMKALMFLGAQVAVRSLLGLCRGEEEYARIKDRLALHGGLAPLVKIDGRFLDPFEVAVLIGEQ